VAHNRGTSIDRIEANLGLGSGLVGDAATIVERVRQFEQAGVDVILVKLEGGAEEAERFARAMIPANQGSLNVPCPTSTAWPPTSTSSS
jgi:alkanesulfonate monooxygenase SsuD/methylene tetrahydromethanopterin reductase-like flavin-dependent oxidoreductase (luciferase family)